VSTKQPTRDEAHWEQVEDAAELLQQHEVERALLALRTVLREHNDNPYAFDLLGTALFEARKFAEAADAYRAAVRLSPDFLGARVGLSHALRVSGDARGALEAAKAALARFPKDGEAHHAAGLAHAALGQRNAAKKELEGFLASGAEFEAATEVRQILEMLGLGEEGEPVEFE
jgi:cytochrome c-type biogenesis protein CcmH/NrfG